MQAKRVILLLTIFAIFGAIVVGAYVTVAGFGNACGSEIPRDWPGCLGGLFPPPQLAPVMEYLHRILAALSTLLLLVTAALYVRDKTSSGGTKKVLLVAVGLLITQVLLGGVVIAREEEAVLVAAHQGLAVLTFGFAVAAYVWSKRLS